ncbi:MAG: hypothetical protein V4574_08495 [Pseudomonadota bacterium]
MEIQTLIQSIVSRALDDSGEDVLGRVWLNRGDGGYLALRGDVQLAPRVLAAMCARFETERETVKIRYALHSGFIEVKPDRLDSAVVGHAIDELAFLLSHMERDPPGQVLITDVYRQLLEEAGVRDKRFTPLPDMIDKNGKRHAVWNYRSDQFGVAL